ncbi:MAG: VCBS repeat-containing protein [Ignavibacteriales bacterium]|nr:VCBS repeat-containing protein [Ignavibacteriales bacterium]
MKENKCSKLHKRERRIGFKLFVVFVFGIVFYGYVLSALSTKVIAITPSQNAVNIPTGTSIQIIFSNPMDISSINDTTIRVYNERTGLQGATFTFSQGNTTVDIVPIDPFTRSEIVTIVVSKNCKDDTGVNITPFISQFTLASSKASEVFVEKVNVFVKNNPYDIIVGDWDKDRDIDLATTNKVESGGVTILANNGSGSFSITQNSSGGKFPYSLCSGDFDNDGDLDVVVANKSSDSVSVLKNNGGVFTKFVTLFAGNLPRSIKAGDFDGDGWLDVVVANEGSQDVRILRNDRSGGKFSQLSTIDIGDSAFALAVGDLNNDGDFDIAVSRWKTNSIVIITNNSDGTFTPSAPLQAGIAPKSIIVGDFIPDSFLDIAVGNFNDTTITIFKNVGTGIFNLYGTVGTRGEPFALTTNDIDGDGDVDIISANWFPSIVNILKNDSTGNFSRSSTEAVNSQPKSITGGDFNDDGFIDYATTSDGSDSVTILRIVPYSSISGNVFWDMNGNGVIDNDDTVGLPGWKILIKGLRNDSVFSDEEGNYLFKNLLLGNYTVQEVIPLHWQQTFPLQPTYTINITAGGSTFNNNDFGNFKFGSISGTVFHDTSNDGIKDVGEVGIVTWKVKLTGTQIKDVLTDKKGFFLFTDEPS